MSLGSLWSGEGLCVAVHSNGTSCEMLTCDGLPRPCSSGTAPLFIGFLEKGEAANAPNQQRDVGTKHTQGNS